MFRIPQNNTSAADSLSAAVDMSVSPDSPLSMSLDQCSPPSPLATTATDSDSAGNGSPGDAVAGSKRRRRKKKRLCESLSTARFKDIYYLTGDVLGEGSYGRVETCINMLYDTEYAVKLINKSDWCFSRAKVLKEVEIYYLCQGQQHIIQLIEYFEEEDYFYLVFEKMNGGPLLDQIQRRVKFTEEEAVKIIRDLASALKFLHQRGIAHRDLKPENVLCVSAESPWPIKLCDFDLCSGVHQSLTTPLLQSPVGSAEYMAPEVVNAFHSTPYDRDDDDDDFSYDKRCDLWSLGVLAYVLLCGYLPFAAATCEDVDCGWETGEAECAACQKSLFRSICSGELVFPDSHSWASVSYEAKDLISRLLVRAASQRLEAEAVLEHPWIVGGGSSAAVETPSVLRRQTSTTSLKWAAFQRQISQNHNNNLGRLNDNDGCFHAVNQNLRKKSVNDRLLMSMRQPVATGAETDAFAKTRKSSLASSMMSMRRQTSLIFHHQPDHHEEEMLLQHRTHFNLHR
jgi:MAP kinase interacting serine/threonine kinase